MKVLGISGSPRKNGNTEMALDAALEGARSGGAVCEKILLNGLNFKPCQECGLCDKDGICKIADDMQIIYEKIDEADVIIVASPVFFGSVSAQLKMMIDRFQCRWVLKYRLREKTSSSAKKRGFFLCVAATDRVDFFDNARKPVKILFAVLDINYSGELFCPGGDAKNSVGREGECIDRARSLGASLAAGRG